MLPIGGGYVHAGGTARLDANAGDQGPREHGEIRTRQGGHEQRARARIAPAAVNGGLAKAVSLGIEAGEIIAVSIPADCRECIEKHLIQAIGPRDMGHVDGSVEAVYLGVAPVGVVFRQSKVGQHVIPTPAGVAGGRPIVVIPGVAAVIGHAVDGAGTTDHLAARQRNAAVAAPTNAGTWMKGWRAGPPASIRQTRVRGSSERRAASTHPAVPAPTMT